MNLLGKEVVALAEEALMEAVLAGARAVEETAEVSVEAMAEVAMEALLAGPKAGAV